MRMSILQWRGGGLRAHLDTVLADRNAWGAYAPPRVLAGALAGQS